MNGPDVGELIRRLIPDRRLRFYFTLLMTQVIVYTALIHNTFPRLEGRSITLLESLFFVIETITTVGYGDQLPFTNQYTFAIVLFIMVTGVFTILMIVPVMLAPYITTMLLATPPRKTPYELKDHVVIIGYGELTRALVESLMIASHPIVIVEESEAKAQAVKKRYQRDVFVVWGSYGEASTWTNAWVQNASNIIVCEDERIAATVILGIRELATGKIIAVVDDLSFDRYLRYAGAEYVLSPKNVTGRILTRHAVLRPDADTIYEAISLDRIRNGRKGGTALKLIKVPIMEGCRCIGQSLGELALFENYGVDVLFFWKSGEFVLEPKETDTLDTSTMLFLLGHADILPQVLEKEFMTVSNGEDIAVIAGYGDVGKASHREFESLGIHSVIVDPGAHATAGVRGNAEDESVLREAHIEDARFCVVAVNDDNVNIFTTLMARNMNPSLRILARANDPASIDKLYRAGADYVALLPTIGGQVVAGIVLADVVQVLLDLPNARKVVMKHLMKHAPATVGWLEQKSGVRVIGIESADRSVIRPGRDEPIREGDAVIAVGEIRSLKRFISLI
jgi:voltage-gated potassium channel